MFKKKFKTTQLKPKDLFLIDGFGAILSAFLLGVVLVKFESVFGIPSSILYTLAIFPVLFAIYDFYSYKQNESRLGYLLKGIALINILYCCLSLVLAFFQMETITFFGWVYIVSEIAIVLIIARIEYNVAVKLIKHSNN